MAELNYRRHHVGFDLDTIQQAAIKQGLDLEELAYKPLGKISGPYHGDCNALIGELLIVDPESNCFIDLPKIRPVDIGRLVTVRCNTTEYSVIVRPADDEDRIEGAGSTTLSSNEEIIFVVLPDNNWAAFRFSSAASTAGGAENGFVDTSQSDEPVFDNGTRTAAISPKSSFYSIFSEGAEVVIFGTRSVVVPDVTGLYWIYFDKDGELQCTSTFSVDLISEYALVAFLCWNSTDAERVTFTDERHGTNMPWSVHYWAHLTLRAMYESGLGLGNMSVDGTGNDAANARLSIANGIIHDEDKAKSIVNGSPQTLSSIAELPIMYRYGASGDWRKIAATTYCVAIGTLAQWNEWTGATWQRTDHVTGKFGLMHIYATPDVYHPCFYIMGQGTYNNVIDARIGATNELSQLELGALKELIPEAVPIATIIIQTKTTYTNAVKTRIVSTSGGNDYVDWRVTGIVPSGGSSGTTSPLTTKGDLWGFDTDNARVPVGTDTHVLKADSSNSRGISYSQVKDSELSTSDITTNNATTSKHGFLKKLNGVGSNFLDGAGNWDTVTDSDLSLSDTTLNDVSSSKHGFCSKLPNTTNTFLRGDGQWKGAYTGHSDDDLSETSGIASKSDDFDRVGYNYSLSGWTWLAAGSPSGGSHALAETYGSAFLSVDNDSTSNDFHTYAHAAHKGYMIGSSYSTFRQRAKVSMMGLQDENRCGIWLADGTSLTNMVWIAIIKKSDGLYVQLGERRNGTYTDSYTNYKITNDTPTLELRRIGANVYPFVGFGTASPQMVNILASGLNPYVATYGGSWTNYYHGIFAWNKNSVFGESGTGTMVARFWWYRMFGS